jgi:hypothetical protein
MSLSAAAAAAATTATAFAPGRLSSPTSPRRSSLSLPSSSSYFLSGAFPRAIAVGRRAAVAAHAQARKSVLVLNTNGGGHAVIGFYLAKELLAAGHAVTVLTVGDEASDKMKKPPFSRFSVFFPPNPRIADLRLIIG